MRVKRIGTLRTMRQYEQALLEDVLPKYLAKSGCKDTPQEILADMRLECHNPFIITCVAVDEVDRPIGFVMARLVIGRRGRNVFVDHMYAPNLGLTSKLYELVKTKLGADDVMWVTYRNPEAWVKFSKKNHHPAEVYGWILRESKEV